MATKDMTHGMVVEDRGVGAEMLHGHVAIIFPHVTNLPLTSTLCLWWHLPRKASIFYFFFISTPPD